MIGRIIAALIVLGCVGLFVWSYDTGAARTVHQTLAALGLTESHSHVTAVYREPDYEEREGLAP